MYVEKNGHVIVVHLFLGASEDNHFQFTGSSISDALTKMNAVKGVLPNGVIRYQTENGWYQEFIVDPPSWTTSEVLGVASLVLAVIAIPVTGGASVALVVASTTTGITSSGFAMYEENLKGQLSTGETWQHSGFMVANLLPMVRGISTLAKLSKTSGLLGKIGTVTEGYNYLKASVGVGVGATTIDGIIIADSYYTKFKEIDKMTHLSREARDAKRAQLLREGLITGMITLTGLLDLASLKRPNSKGSKHWADADIPVSGKNKSTGTITDANTTHPLTGSIEQTGTKKLSESTQPGTVSGKKKTTKVVVAKDAEGNFHQQNPETGEFERITKEEFEQIEAITKKNSGEVVKSEKKGKLGEDTENGVVKNADENLDDLTTKTKENEVVPSKENGKLGESSLKELSETENLEDLLKNPDFKVIYAPLENGTKIQKYAQYNVTIAEESALKLYIQEGYYANFNNALAGQAPMTPEYATMRDLLISAHSKLPKEARVVYRGAGITESNFAKGLTKGQKFDFEGRFTSSSTEESIADLFRRGKQGDVVWQIESKTGIDLGLINSSEAEILLKPYTQYELIDIIPNSKDPNVFIYQIREL